MTFDNLKRIAAQADAHADARDVIDHMARATGRATGMSPVQLPGLAEILWTCWREGYTTGRGEEQAERGP